MSEDISNSKVAEFRRRMNELERAKRDTDKLRHEAIAELLQRRREINRELRQLGYEGDVADQIREDEPVAALPASLFDTSTNGPKRKRMKSTREKADRKCPICEVEGHDLRAHRGQDVKRPFTPEERAARGL